MAKISWSFPTSPRNPSKIPFELKIFLPLVKEWSEQGKIWSPQTTQIEFGKALRDFEVGKDEEDAEESLAFQKQTDEISEMNLAWTARARFGTLKFLGLVSITKDGYAELTKQGSVWPIQSGRTLSCSNNSSNGNIRIISTRVPSILKVFFDMAFCCCGPAHQGMRGLTKNEFALFCFLMTTMRASLRRVRHYYIS